jgi:hypothetical protein
LPGHEIFTVVIEHGQQLLVVDIAQRSPRLIFAEKTKMSEQLTEPDVGGKRDKFFQHG